MSLSRVVACAVLCLCGWRSPAVADEHFRSGGVRINYRTHGAGEPVMLIHGWLSSGWVNWELPGIARALAENHQVVWFDLPAHGRSDAPAHIEAYGPELVEHVVRLMDHLKFDRAHIAGYSMGGIIAAKLAAIHPDRVLSMHLGGMGWLREGSIEQRVFAAGGGDGKPVGLCFRSMASLALTEKELLSISAPTRVLFGEEDGLKALYLPPLRRARADWPVIEIPDANHLNCILKPQFAADLKTWIDDHRQRDAAPEQPPGGVRNRAPAAETGAP